MTTYRFWSGLNTIGGNIVEVRTDTARVLCDFGLSVPNGEPELSDNMPELEKLLLQNELPAVPGLYDTTQFTTLDLLSCTDDSLETVLFVSHLHLDHMGGLKYLPEGTTVYLSQESVDLYHALSEVGEEQPIVCDIRSFEYGETIEVGDIHVTPKQSDHDVEGSCAFFIGAPELKLIHSGDFRMTGDHPERVSKWLQEAKEWQPDVLLLEGTTFSFEEEKEKEIASEAELRRKWKELLEKESNRLLIFNPYIRNVERIYQIVKLAQAAGREVVLEPEYAEVLAAVYPNENWTILSGEGAIQDDHFVNKMVTLEEIQKKPSRYVLQNSYKHRLRLDKFKGSVYCHSNGEPLGEYDPRYQVLTKWLEQLTIEWVDLSTSGHATQNDLLAAARQAGAKVTVPWHTFRPEVFHQALTEAGVTSLLPEAGVYYKSEGTVPSLTGVKER